MLTHKLPLLLTKNAGRVKVDVTSANARMSTSSLVITILSTPTSLAMSTLSRTDASLGTHQISKSNTGRITSMTFKSTTMVEKVSRMASLVILFPLSLSNTRTARS